MPVTRNVCDFCGGIIEHVCTPQPSSIPEVAKLLREQEARFNAALRDLQARVDNLRIADDE